MNADLFVETATNPPQMLHQQTNGLRQLDGLTFKRVSPQWPGVSSSVAARKANIPSLKCRK